MDWVWFLFGFQGRINRAKYWLWHVIFVIASLLFMMLFSGYIHNFAVLESHLGDDAPLSAFIPFFVIGLPAIIVGTWAIAATAIKRLHDRGKSGWWMVPFYIVPAFLRDAVDRTNNPHLFFVIVLAGVVLTIWGFVEVFCLKGTPGTNRFGPDPLSPQKRTGRLMAHR